MQEVQDISMSCLQALSEPHVQRTCLWYCTYPLLVKTNFTHSQVCTFMFLSVNENYNKK